MSKTRPVLTWDTEGYKQEKTNGLHPHLSKNSTKKKIDLLIFNALSVNHVIHVRKMID